MFRASWAERFYGIGMGNYDLKNPDAACAFPGTARGTPRRALRQGQCISGSVREIDTTNLDLTTLSELALIKPAAQPVRVVSIHHKETLKKMPPHLQDVLGWVMTAQLPCTGLRM